MQHDIVVSNSLRTQGFCVIHSMSLHSTTSIDVNELPFHVQA